MLVPGTVLIVSRSELQLNVNNVNVRGSAGHILATPVRVARPICRGILARCSIKAHPTMKCECPCGCSLLMHDACACGAIDGVPLCKTCFTNHLAYVKGNHAFVNCIFDGGFD